MSIGQSRPRSSWRLDEEAGGMLARSTSIGAAALLLLVAVTGPAGAFCPSATPFRAAPALRSRWTCSDEVPRVPSPACAPGKELNGQRRDALRDMLGAGLALSIAVVLPVPAVAERTFESMKKAKANYLPRLTKGLTFYEGPLREAIDAGEWDTVSSAVKEKGAAWALAHVDKYASGVVGEVVELKGPLKVFASSITATDSETQATQKLYSYLAKYVEFNGKLGEAAAAQDQEAAVKAWKGGCVALRLYVDGLNAALPRSVGKMTLPAPPYGKVEIPVASAANSEDE